MKPKVFNRWEIALVIATVLIFTIANSLHVFIEWFKNKPGFIFHAIAHSYPDYFLYLSHVAQGAAGTLIYTRHMFTNEPLPKTAFYWVYSIVGFIGAHIGITPPWSYNLSLLLFVATTIALWYIFCRTLYPANMAKRLITFLVILTASPFIRLQSLITRGAIEFPKELWFSPAPSFNRLGGVPHQVVQTILLLLVLFGFTKTTTIKQYSWKTICFIIGLMTLSFVTTQSQPLQMALLLSAIGISTVITAVKNKTFDIKRFVPIFLAGLVSIPAALSVSREYTTPIYTIAKQWELLQYTPTGFLWWIAAMGPIALFIPFGIWPFIKKADPFRLIFFSYGLLSFVSYNSPIPKLLGVVSQRFLHPAPYALLPILAVAGFFAIQKDIARFIKNKRFTKAIQTVFVIGSVLFYGAYTIPANFAQITIRITDPHLAEASALNHTPIPMVTALTSIQRIKNNPVLPVVLADENLGIDLLVPLYTGHISFLGQAIHTLYPDEKAILRHKFFTGAMTDTEVKTFLFNHRIGYVIAAPTQQKIIALYPFFTLAFQNDVAAVYTVQL